jgi:hypothetical protein
MHKVAHSEHVQVIRCDIKPGSVEITTDHYPAYVKYL